MVGIIPKDGKNKVRVVFSARRLTNAISMSGERIHGVRAFRDDDWI